MEHNATVERYGVHGRVRTRRGTLHCVSPAGPPIFLATVVCTLSALILLNRFAASEITHKRTAVFAALIVIAVGGALLGHFATASSELISALHVGPRCNRKNLVFIVVRTTRHGFESASQVLQGDEQCVV